MKQIRSMSFKELVKARGEIEAAIDMHVAQERQNLTRALQQIGLVQPSATARSKAKVHALKGKKLPPLYRNPDDRSETWAGRGNKPRWLAAALKRGKKLHSFAIK